MSAKIEPAERFARNVPSVSPDEQLALSGKRVCVCGCGGLGGYVIECLARIGVGTIVAVDGDAFEVSNLNRQLLCCEDNLGESKAIAARERVHRVNSDVHVVAHDEPITPENAPCLLAGCDAVVDALDSAATRLQLENWCANAGVPLIHGALSGWFAQMTTIAPGSGALERVYPGIQAAEPEGKPSALPFTAAFVAAIQASECVKVLLGKGDILYGKLALVDLLHGTWRIIEL